MYRAVICKIDTSPRDDLDNLVVGHCLGYQVLVGKDVKSGTLGIFFESDGQLSEEFATKNDLLIRKDEEGNRAGGYFDPKKRRVTSIRLRGYKSEGFWCPLDKLSYTGYDLDKLKEGFEFDELNGHPICNKYVTPKTLRELKRKTGQSRVLNSMFKPHVDTAAFKRSLKDIPDDSFIVITEKLHGTSHRFGRVLCDVRPKGKLKRLLHFLKRKPNEEWKYLHGSRRVILNPELSHEGWYGSNEFRYKPLRDVTLKKGEILYGEIVGWVNDQTPVMPHHSTSKIGNVSSKKAFGEEIIYHYGCAKGESKFFIYKITQTDEDGHTLELSWNQLLQRAKELNLPVVPLLDKFQHDGDREFLKERVAYLTERSLDAPELVKSVLGDHPMEGVVVRIESEYGTQYVKNKGFFFGLMEGYLKNSDDYVDTEESS